MNASDSGRILQKIRAFPTMPQSTTKVLHALADPDADAGEVEKAVMYDPGLTANILRLANSAHFGFAGTIGNMRDAIVRLGRKKIMDLVVAASVNETLSEEVGGYAIPAGFLWEHSMAVAVAADLIERRIGMRAQDSVFTAAILHDIGKLILGDLVGERQKSIDAAITGGMSFDLAERDSTGVDHAEVGARLLSSWAFPDNLVRAARFHHRPDDLDVPDRCVDIVHVADCLTMMIGLNEGVEGLSYRISAAVEERLGLDEDMVADVALQTLEGVQEMRCALDDSGPGAK